MDTEKFRKRVESFLALADIKVNGNKPYDIQVHNKDFFQRVLADGSLGLGESYMDGWWDCERLDEFFCRVLKAKLDRKVRQWKNLLPVIQAKLVNLQTKSRAFHVGSHHYDIGNELFRRMLDRRMIYSCGYWKDARSLDEAQEAKLELICKKLGIEKGMKVLDIGCGWGGTARYIAEKCGAQVLGITVSKKQVKCANEMCKGLPVKIRYQDYRCVNGKFDRVVSVGMFEHVGYKNYKRFMKLVRKCLRDDGLFLLHTIGGKVSVVTTDPWISKYIFPNGMLPSAKQICSAAEDVFVLEDWHSFGADYEKTLMAWYGKFESAWSDLRICYDERFRRMWRYYLLSCAGAFRARENQLWQIVFSPEGVPGGYVSVR